MRINSQTYRCDFCKKRVGESDIILTYVKSDVGWKRKDGTVDYPPMKRDACGDCYDKHESEFIDG